MRLGRVLVLVALVGLWIACDKETPAGPENPEVAGVQFETADPPLAEQQTASEDGTGEVIYACYNPWGGNVYRIKAEGLRDKCRRARHVEFSWHEQGPQGDPGPKPKMSRGANCCMVL